MKNHTNKKGNCLKYFITISALIGVLGSFENGAFATASDFMPPLPPPPPQLVFELNNVSIPIKMKFRRDAKTKLEQVNGANLTLEDQLQATLKQVNDPEADNRAQKIAEEQRRVYQENKNIASQKKLPFVQGETVEQKKERFAHNLKIDNAIASAARYEENQRKIETKIRAEPQYQRTIPKITNNEAVVIVKSNGVPLPPAPPPPPASLKGLESTAKNSKDKNSKNKNITKTGDLGLDLAGEIMKGKKLKVTKALDEHGNFIKPNSTSDFTSTKPNAQSIFAKIATTETFNRDSSSDDEDCSSDDEDWSTSPKDNSISSENIVAPSSNIYSGPYHSPKDKSADILYRIHTNSHTKPETLEKAFKKVTQKSQPAEVKNQSVIPYNEIILVEKPDNIISASSINTNSASVVPVIQDPEILKIEKELEDAQRNYARYSAYHDSDSDSSDSGGTSDYDSDRDLSQRHKRKKFVKKKSDNNPHASRIQELEVKLEEAKIKLANLGNSNYESQLELELENNDSDNDSGFSSPDVSPTSSLLSVQYIDGVPEHSSAARELNFNKSDPENNSNVTDEEVVIDESFKFLDPSFTQYEAEDNQAEQLVEQELGFLNSCSAEVKITEVTDNPEQDSYNNLENSKVSLTSALPVSNERKTESIEVILGELKQLPDDSNIPSTTINEATVIAEAAVTHVATETLEESRELPPPTLEPLKAVSSYKDAEEDAKLLSAAEEFSTSLDIKLEDSPTIKALDEEECILTDSEKELEVKEVITQVKTPKQRSITDQVRHVFHSLFNRMNLSPTVRFVAAAAGDNESSIERGIWVSGLYGANRQSNYQNTLAYRGYNHGGTIGFDIEGESIILGIAYSNINSHFKYDKKDDKTSIKSHIFSLYGQKELTQSISLQATGSFSRSYIKNLNKNIIGKYRNNSYSVNGLLNYKHITAQNIIIVPNIGLRYDHSRDGIYKENDLSIRQLSISGKSQDLWTSSVGTRILFPIHKSRLINITPGLHSSIEKTFNSKKERVTANLIQNNQVVENTISLSSQPKIGYNLGASLLLEKNNIKVSTEYNCHIRKKYQSHQVFVKLKINF